MGYICGDRGTDKCPCILMETGQCYTCGMNSRGICDCLSSWQGVCPYNEYVQNGHRLLSKTEERVFEIKSIEDFSEKLKVMTIDAPMGFALECGKVGAFLMVEAKGYKMPLSVMEANAVKDSSVKLAVYLNGPKSYALDGNMEKGGKIRATGPFFNGLVNSEKFDRRKLSLIIGKGIAVMPILNIKNVIGGSMAGMYLDESKLTREFARKYVAPLEYKKVEFDSDFDRIAEMICGDYRYCVSHTGQAPNVFLMVSPYYKKLIVEKCGFDEKNIIVPNHANMCCGEGVCGACSFTDENGVTVKMCKCIDL